MGALKKHLDEVVNVSWNNAGRLRDHQDHVMNAAVGLATEAGEVLDCHKKLYYHREKDRRAEIVDEIGDVFFYLLKLLDLHEITIPECLNANRMKLKGRYSEVFNAVKNGVE